MKNFAIFLLFYFVNLSLSKVVSNSGDVNVTQVNKQINTQNVDNNLPVPSEIYQHKRYLDSKRHYVLFWNSNQTHIIFEVHVKTRGYVGFGISPNGKMYPADVVVGWVTSDGNVHFKDCHTVGHVAPVVDHSQDWTLIRGKEYSFGTMLKFARKLDTCDSDDIKITDDTVRLIFSYHPDDPTSMASIPWHGATNRGVRSALLLSGPVLPQHQLPSDIKTYDMVFDKYHVPATDTIYMCKAFKFPHLDKKHHMIKYEPIITPGNELHVHHLVITQCMLPVNDSLDGIEYECDYHNYMPKELYSCYAPFIAWAVGGGAFYMPDHVGFPLGTPDAPTFFVMQMHYDNPAKLSNIVDSSGMRITYSPTLRQHDASFLGVGSRVRKQQFIPPFEKDFVTKAFSTEECLRKSLDQRPKGINVFALFQHAHLLGAGITTRLIRNNTEIEPIADDKHYDFNYQDVRLLRQERKLLAGDRIMVECHYDSSKRTRPTLGGLSTREEMCISYMMIYPKIEVSSCWSSPTYDNVADDPKKAVEILETWNWTDPSVRKHFKEIQENSTYEVKCSGKTPKPWSTKQYLHIKEPKTRYIPPASVCKLNTSKSSPSQSTPTGDVISDVVYRNFNASALPVPSENFTHQTQLDGQGNAFAFWKFNDTHITIELHYKTRGYVAFGISPNGRMYPADVVIGWVTSDGIAHLKDCHTVGHVMPVVDQSQDIQLLHGEETAFGTILKFVRALDTCDTDDMKITDETMRLIYSYHPDDPTSMTSLPYHGATRRGSLSKLLLSGSTVPDTGLPSDIKHFDFLFNNFHVPAQDTTYMCKAFKFPELKRKHHMIKFEPVITPGNELNVHHIIISQCIDHINDSYDGIQYECDTQYNEPKALRSCYILFIGWAIGGQEFYFPKHVGVPIGVPGEPAFYVMQLHYDNPMRKSGIIDSSGIRILYTPTLRQYDAQFMSFGQHTNSRLYIPPFEKSLLSQGFSREDCLRKSLDQRPDGINVIAVFHHSHLLGRAMRTRLVRNGTEIEPISADNHYDFNFQDYRLLKKERKLYAGDRIIVDCVYDSTTRTKPTLGGLGTHEEMCLSSLLVYPKIEVSVSTSSPVFDNIADDPKKAVAILNTWNWTDPNVREKFQNTLYNSSYDISCFGRTLTPAHTTKIMPYPEPAVKYMPPQSKCAKRQLRQKTSLPLTNTNITTMDVPVPTMTYKHKKQLDADGNYFVFWQSNNSHITFEVHVKTRGYVGFGFSPNGKMYPSDVIVGWVSNNGTVHMKDCHTIGYVMPVVDQSQDVYLLHGEENNFGTVLKFVRALDTCDKDDMKITDDTMRFIYSYHPDDPTSMTSLPYHGATRRGSVSGLLLSESTVPKTGLPSDTKTFDFVFNNYHLPSQNTTYMCKAFKIPEMKRKHHMIKFEPVITPGNELNVHHLIVTACSGYVNDSYNGYEYECDNIQDNQPDALMSCYLYFIGWAVGGEAFYFPEHVGVPLGVPGDPTFFVMQLHYDNPMMKSGIVDSSGIRISYTSTLRQHDAMFMSLGQDISERVYIPPFEKSFLSQGFTREDCLRKSLDQRPDGINVIAVFHHSHLLGSAMRTRLVRNDTEIEPIAVDNHYDFNFQEMRLLKKERKIYAGDRIIVDCVYDSTKRTKPTLGGLSTHEEMCLSSILVYPRIEVIESISSPIYDNVADDPKKAFQIFNTWNWTDPNVRQKFQKILFNSSYEISCFGRGLNPPYTTKILPYPAPEKEYTPPAGACTNRTRQSHKTEVKTMITSHEQHDDSSSLPAPTQTYSYRKQLDSDGNYFVYWQSNTTHITFEVHVKTRGYVGFGLSPNGKMYPSDVVIGWVSSNGTTYFKDCHTVDHVPPVVDQSQDWILLSGSENNFGTVLKFVRALDTCDADDIPISDNTMRLIYAYHPDDPVSMDTLSWHGVSRRGARSAILLSGPSISKNPLPTDSKHFDFTANKIHIPGKDTTYMCSTFKFPKLDRKHHAIKYVPIIQSGNEKHVHHMVLRYCTGNVDSSLEGTLYDCLNKTPTALKHCYSIFMAWAVGGEAYEFPDNVGMSLGTPDDPTFFILETHYDNPTLETDIVDSSGLRIIYTPTLRKYDAATMVLGEYTSAMQFIPPYENDFLEQGFCSEECLRKELDSRPNGINAFAVFQHMHLLGRKISTRLVRNGTEQEPIAEDNSYDFNYQNIRALRRERKILAGDRLIVDCHYDSSKRTKPTLGGYSTSEEMCISFIMYYPKVGIQNCMSYKTLSNVLPNDGNVTNPYAAAIKTLMSWDWSDPAVRQRFKEVLRNTTYKEACDGKTLKPPHSTIDASYPEPRQRYVPRTSPCTNNQGNNNGHHSPTLAKTNRRVENNITIPPAPTEAFTHRSKLDNNGSFLLYWKSNKTHITFEAQVKTRGYIGFGISPNGKMYPSDVVIGWVDSNGQAHLKDCHTVGHVAPVVDQSQDWILLHGEENNFGTSLKFVRALDTCDSDDIVINDDTMRLIYAYHPDDPVSIHALSWHGASRRGARSVLLLSGPEVSRNPLPADSKHFDFIGNKIHVPGKDTTYMCTGFAFPKLDRKHHMIKYVPIVQPGNEKHVHHIVLHYCKDPIDSSLDGAVYECYNNTPHALRSCFSIFMAWAVGGEEYNFPDNVGMPLGTHGDPKFFILETHYDNPTLRTDIVDSSGVRIIFTPTLRKYDAAALILGESANTLEFIPPFEKDFVEQGFCSEKCLRKGLDSQPDGINAFAVFHHMHLLGRKISTRLVRNGTEIEPIAVDNNYDFDYQDIRALSRERKILAGDRLIVDCHYDSSKNTKPTTGGLSTREEMCFSFLMYYPKMSVEHCLSYKTFDNIPRDSDVLVSNPYHSAPTTLYTWNWTDPMVRQRFDEIRRNTTYNEYCMGTSLHPQYSVSPTSYPEPKQKYIPKPRMCSQGTSRNQTIDTAVQHVNTHRPSTVKSLLHDETFTNTATLDKNGSFILDWKTNETHITFKVQVKTRGYIGFGISPNGKMYPSDVVIGWIENDGTVHFKIVTIKMRRQSFLWILPLVLCVLGELTPSESFNNKAILDRNGSYVLYWKFNDTHITFEVHAKTRGYVGFGISPNGKMYPSDVVVGWINNDGKAHFKDCHTTGHVQPIVDKSQDWTLLHGEENSFGTTLKFVRPLKTCDSDDIEISDDTAHVIYAYHPDDPQTMTSLPWHGASRRGAKSLLLLSKSIDVAMPSDVKTFDFLNGNYHVPGKDTTYHCTTFKLPDLGKKHHMIKYEPIVSPGNELNVHHILVYSCLNDIPSNLAGQNFDCYHHRPTQFQSCYLVFIAWAIGGEAFYFPHNTGMSLGTANDPSFFLMETHYDNPTMKTDIVDNSGIRIYYTPTLRQHDAGILETGVNVNELQFIPPFEDAFTSTGVCPENSLRIGMKSQPNGVNVFGVLQHSHLLGRAIKTRLVNNGTEKKPLAVDNHYDFDYQEVRLLRPERKIVPGDEIIVECTYNSKHKSSPTLGGLTTRDEMCLTFIMYYPKINLELCNSLPMYEKIDKDSRHAVAQLKSWNWRDPTIRQKFKDILKTSKYYNIRSGKTMHPTYQYEEFYLRPPTHPYVEPQKTCLNSTSYGHQGKLNLPSNHMQITTQGHNQVTQKSQVKPTSPLTPTELYTHKTKLDTAGNYLLYWKVNKTHIVFETLVKTRGYIGFGISSNGKMFPADVVAGWVADDGTAHLYDYHTTGHVPPVLDQSQDWILLHGEENHNGTLLKFSRKLDTCDNDDMKITDDTIHVIYSYHPSDPQSATSLSWHGATRRGAKSMLLLSAPKEANIVMPADVKTFEFLNGNYHVPGKGTTYHCTSWKFPDLGQKHHMIKYEPVITPGNELNVHHILVYHCTDNIDPSLAGRSYECYSHQRVRELGSCYLTYIAWAIGGQAFYYPSNVGMPIGTSQEPSFFVMETHYDNPTIKTDIVDNSGIRIYYTPTLRQHDAGNLQVGMHVNQLQLIPPFEDQFISQGYCSESCLRKGMHSHPEGIKVFGVLQHAHLLGRGIRTRIVRNGVEVEPLASDSHYDFDYQDIRLLRQERTILPGDGIIVDCMYNSSQRSIVTHGGLTTRDEMCLTFILYYPRIDTDVCESSPKYNQISGNSYQAVSILAQWNWKDPAVRQKFHNVLNSTTYRTRCSGKHLQPSYILEDTPYFEPRQKYVEPKGMCPAA